MAVTVSIPVDLRAPDITTNAGNSFWTVTGIDTDMDVGHWEFLKDVQGDVYGEVRIPPNMAATPNVYFEAHISHTAATTGEVTQLAVDYRHLSTGESMTGTWSTSTARDFTVTNTADVVEVVRLPQSGTITAPVAGDWTLIRLRHNGAAGADTLTQNTRVHRLDMIIDLA